ncbi:DsbA family protein [Herbaspirillum huttiense]|uniref:DsbA family protein n=1 Tax=Herbaspirillum huttiense TaxID=863372 RepID=UPI001066A9A0|nr:DsbA family protein [Herbaspirillum huttiense]QBP77934.1 DsbA family protein [Herbaspirillum huttiense]
MTTPAAPHDTVLHYIHDPLCGWCYGAAPLVAAARAVLPVQAHGGGMLAGRNRRRVDAQLRDYVMPHDQRIAQMTGQAFGEPYFNGLLRDTEAVFDSAPPIAAVLAVQALKGDAAGLDMLAAIQRAHYQQGRRISEVATLTELAHTLGIDAETFASELQRVEQEELANHIEASRELLNYVGGRGFPTFVLQRGDTLEVLDTGRWLGQPEEWVKFLREETAAASSAAPSATAAQNQPAQCDLETGRCD